MKRRMHPHSFLRMALLSVCLAGAAQPWLPACGAEPVRIGVMAFRPKPQIQAQWQALAGALNKAMPERDFVVEALDYPEMEMAVRSRELDFVLTNPGHYVLLARRYGLSSPLATLATNEGGQRTSVLGGVMFVRAEPGSTGTLGEIKGKTIATVSTDSLGGYQIEAYELKQAGIRLPQDAKLLITGMPHDKVIEAVLAGRADVGFVRTGLLEAMAREGKLDMARLKILNRQNLPEFPVAVSTHLYPEWPFAAMPHTDENLTRHVAAALFHLEENTAATHTMGIHGFVVPADYTPVADLLRELRAPPFDAMPAFTAQDIWARYPWQIAAASLSGGLILLLGIWLLIVNRKLDAEKRLVLEQQRELQASEQRMELALSGGDLTTWDLQVASDGLIFNGHWAEMLGYAAAELAPRTDSWEAQVHPDDLPAIKEQFARHVQGETPILESEYRVRHKDGRWIWVLARGKVVEWDQAHHPLRLVGTVLDITGRKADEAELRRSNAELEQYSYTISHDLRQPLRMITSYLHLLERSLADQLDDEKREYFHFASEGAQRLDQMMAGLLEYSRVGRKGEPPAWVDSRALLDQALLFLQPAIGEAQAELGIQGEWPRLFVSPDEILRLMQNLVGNAVKFRVSGRTPKITVTSETSAGTWRLSVADNGVGIIPGQIDRLFQVFQRLQSRAVYEGTGVGLALCRKIAEHHHGRIWAASPGENQGATFRVELPIAAGASEANKASGSDERHD